MAYYGDDLARIHDVGFGGFSRESAAGLLEILRGSGVGGGLVVDLGCGSGLWAAELCLAGYDVLGIDLSAAMIALARARAPRATFRRASFLEARLPRCDAVTSLGESLGYLSDPRTGARSLVRLFRRVHGALRPGGLFVFDVHGPLRAGARGRERVAHWEGRNWALLMRVEADPSGRRLTRRITTFRKVGRLYRRAEELHRLCLFRPSEVAEWLRRAGFRVRTLRSYGRRRLPPGRVGFLARKA